MLEVVASTSAAGVADGADHAVVGQDRGGQDRRVEREVRELRRANQILKSAAVDDLALGAGEVILGTVRLRPA